MIPNPGEYIAVPHQIARAYVYDSKHKLLSEADILRKLIVGTLKRGKTSEMNVSLQPIVKDAKPKMIINLLCHYPIVSERDKKEKLEREKQEKEKKK